MTPEGTKCERLKRHATNDTVSDDDVPLLKVLIDRARHCHDRHFTVMKFTGNWRVCFGTPNEVMTWDCRDIPQEWNEDQTELGVGYIKPMPEGRTFAEAALAALEADDALRNEAVDALPRERGIGDDTA